MVVNAPTGEGTGEVLQMGEWVYSGNEHTIIMTPYGDWVHDEAPLVGTGLGAGQVMTFMDLINDRD